VTAATFFTGVRNFEKAMRLRGRVDWALRLIEALRARLSADLQAVDSGGAPSVPVEASSVADDPDPASANEAAALTDRPERGERRERPDRDHFGFGPRGSDKALAEILKRPTDEIIALICRELGLPEDWPRLAEDAWARETADDDGAEPPAPSPSPRMPRIFAAPS
jgi:hypothetical protein